MRAALYTRVSTQEQAEHNFSLGSQLDKLRSYCDLHGHVIIDEYVDAGYSGTTDQRPALAKLFQDVESRLIDIVIIYRLDRFFRSQRHLQNALHFLESRGVGLASVTESFDTTTPTGKAMVSMLGTFAQLERDVFQERTSDGKRKAVQKSAYSGGPVAFGYIWDTESKRLYVESTEADIVRRIFAWVIDGLNTYEIAQRLTNMGIRTRRNASQWHPSSVARIIRNPAYKGEWVFGRKARTTKPSQVTCPSPPIVTPETWEQAQRHLDSNIKHATRNSKQEYMLSGLIRCQCGGSATGTFDTLADGSVSRKYRCYASGGRYPFQGRACTMPPIKADFVESLVWQDIKSFLHDPSNVIETLEAMQEGSGSDRSSQLERIEAKLRQVEDAESRLVVLYTSGSLSREVLDKRAAEIESERRETLSIRAEIEGEQADEEARRAELRGVREQLEALATELEDPTLEQRKIITRSLVSGVIIGTDDTSNQVQPTVKIRYVFGGPAPETAMQTS